MEFHNPWEAPGFFAKAHLHTHTTESDGKVSPAHAAEIFAKAREPKRLIVQPGGDHLMSSTHHQREFLRKAVLWFKRFLFKNPLPHFP